METAIGFIKMALGSNRVKALIVAFAMAAVAKYAPGLVPNEETMNWLYGALLAFIASDTIRPIDPDKPNALSQP